MIKNNKLNSSVEDQLFYFLTTEFGLDHTLDPTELKELIKSGNVTFDILETLNMMRTFAKNIGNKVSLAMYAQFLRNPKDSFVKIPPPVLTPPGVMMREVKNMKAFTIADLELNNAEDIVMIWDMWNAAASVIQPAVFFITNQSADYSLTVTGNSYMNAGFNDITNPSYLTMVKAHRLIAAELRVSVILKQHWNNIEGAHLQWDRSPRANDGPTLFANDLVNTIFPQTPVVGPYPLSPYEAVLNNTRAQKVNFYEYEFRTTWAPEDDKFKFHDPTLSKPDFDMNVGNRAVQGIWLKAGLPVGTRIDVEVISYWQCMAKEGWKEVFNTPLNPVSTKSFANSIRRENDIATLSEFRNSKPF